MKFTRKVFVLILMIFTFVYVNGCGNKGVNDKEMEKVQIKIINKQVMPDGTAYGLKLINGSPYLLKQNSVYISYPIKIVNGSSLNSCKVEASGNKLNIKPNEELNLNVFIKKENYQGNLSLDIENPDIEFNCYVNNMDELSHYRRSGYWKMFDLVYAQGK